MAQASTAKRTTTSKSTAKKVSSEASNDSNVEKVTGTVKDTALVGLGVVGKLFDRAQDRVDGVRTEVPKKWDEFVQRGEQLKDTANDKVNNISFSYKFDMEEQRAKFRDVVDALRAFVTPSKAQ